MLTNKWLNCIFEAREGNHIFVCVIKSINVEEELLIDYNLNHVDIEKFTIVGLVSITYFKPIASN